MVRAGGGRYFSRQKRRIQDIYQVEFLCLFFGVNPEKRVANGKKTQQGALCLVPRPVSWVLRRRSSPRQPPTLPNRNGSPAGLPLVLCSSYARNQGAASEVCAWFLDPMAHVRFVDLEVGALDHVPAMRARARFLELLSSLRHS